MFYRRSVSINYFDLAAAAVLLTLGLVEALVVAEDAPILWQIPLTFVWTVPLIWRRRWPVAVLAIVMAAGVVTPFVNEQGGINSYVFSAILAAYTLGRLLDPPRTWWGPALTVGVNWTAGSAMDAVLSDYVFTALLYGGAWAVGYIMRRRAVEIDTLAQTTDELRRTHLERERQAVEQERARIARELHDIVSHSISVITIQSQATRRRLELSGSDEAESLRVIETTARQAMVEMRRLLGILHATGDPLTLAPQPGINEIPALIAEARVAGIDVTLDVEGEAVHVEQGISLACYRVVQEALTNVRKHSMATSACVLLRYQPGALDIHVDDPGPARAASEGAGRLTVHGGFGLAGMRQRVKLYDGEISAEPQEGGGFRVRIMLPLDVREVVNA